MYTDIRTTGPLYGILSYDKVKERIIVLGVSGRMNSDKNTKAVHRLKEVEEIISKLLAEMDR